MSKKIRDRQNTEKIIFMLWPFYSHRYPDLPVEEIRGLSESQIDEISFNIFSSSVFSAMLLVETFIYGKEKKK